MENIKQISNNTVNNIIGQKEFQFYHDMLWPGLRGVKGRTKKLNPLLTRVVSSSGVAAAATAVPVQHLPRKGFSVPVQVAVERAQLGPIIVPCNSGDGGLQGLRWYARRLRIDEDGDVADEFLDELPADMSMSTENNNRKLPRFEVKYSTKPAKVRNQALLPNGKIQQHVEYQGRLEWV
ncbi:uncharacterized protein Fot_42608 [Forsythia ovata]|uniref:Uncharacterized protein n=1 Tax=Forsythia ovata TaxID=205694 RepID=A0ABD1RMC3_9LAMI